MERIIRAVLEKDLDRSLDFVEKVFTDSEGAENGRLVRNLAAEIRSKKYYLPKLDLVMVNELDEIIGFIMISRFHIEGKYENEFLILSPVTSLIVWNFSLNTFSSLNHSTSPFSFQYPHFDFT